jgi:hypothetical protein
MRACEIYSSENNRTLIYKLVTGVGRKGRNIKALIQRGQTCRGTWRLLCGKVVSGVIGVGQGGVWTTFDREQNSSGQFANQPCVKRTSLLVL